MPAILACIFREDRGRAPCARSVDSPARGNGRRMSTSKPRSMRTTIATATMTSSGIRIRLIAIPTPRKNDDDNHGRHSWKDLGYKFRRHIITRLRQGWRALVAIDAAGMMSSSLSSRSSEHANSTGCRREV